MRYLSIAAVAALSVMIVAQAAQASPAAKDGFSIVSELLLTSGRDHRANVLAQGTVPK